MTSVRPSVMLVDVDCDHIVQQEVEIGTRQDRMVSWIPACLSRPSLYYCLIPKSTEEDQYGMKKM